MTEQRSVAPDDPGVAAWAAVLRTRATVLPVLEREVQDQAGLPLSWYDVLLELHEADERRLRMDQLAARVVLSRTRVSRVVTDLVRAGFVERSPDPEDGRAVLAGITREGGRALRRAAPIYLGAIDEHFSRHLSVAQQDAIATGLAGVLEAHRDG